MISVRNLVKCLIVLVYIVLQNRIIIHLTVSKWRLFILFVDKYLENLWFYKKGRPIRHKFAIPFNDVKDDIFVVLLESKRSKLNLSLKLYCTNQSRDFKHVALYRGHRPSLFIFDFADTISSNINKSLIKPCGAVW